MAFHARNIQVRVAHDLIDQRRLPQSPYDDGTPSSDAHVRLRRIVQRRHYARYPVDIHGEIVGRTLHTTPLIFGEQNGGSGAVADDRE